MADNKPALFPITAFIVSYHYARSDGLCVTRVTAYDLFIATPPSPPYTRPKCALHTCINPSTQPFRTPSRLLPLSPCYHHCIRNPPFHLPAAANILLSTSWKWSRSNGPYVICECIEIRPRLYFASDNFSTLLFPKYAWILEYFIAMVSCSIAMFLKIESFVWKITE